MNTRTKRELQNLMEAIRELAAGVMNTTGMETASKVCDASYKVEKALEQDETILEVS